jgi:hypothetical protein
MDSLIDRKTRGYVNARKFNKKNLIQLDKKAFSIAKIEDEEDHGLLEHKTDHGRRYFGFEFLWTTTYFDLLDLLDYKILNIYSVKISLHKRSIERQFQND